MHSYATITIQKRCLEYMQSFMTGYEEVSETFGWCDLRTVNLKGKPTMPLYEMSDDEFNHDQWESFQDLLVRAKIPFNAYWSWPDECTCYYRPEDKMRIKIIQERPNILLQDLVDIKHDHKQLTNLIDRIVASQVMPVPLSKYPLSDELQVKLVTAALEVPS